MAKSKMQVIWDQMNKTFGNDGLCKIEKIDVINSGSESLNDALGIGGLPRGRVVQYAGKESSGKTLMSLVAIAEWQKLDPGNWAIFVDAEFTYDKKWAKSLGVDTDRVFLIKDNNAKEIFTQLCGQPHKEFGKPKIKLGILDLEKENPSGLGLIVLDSIASLITPIAMTKAVGHTNIAPMGRFLPDALVRLVPLLSQANVTFIAINQVRVDVGKMFGDPMSTPGGKALKHAHSMMVHFTSSESKKNMLFDDSGDVCGHIVGARIDKNKLAPPRRSCQFDIDYLKGVINKHIQIGTLAIKYGVVGRPTLQKYTYGDKQWNGKDNFFQGVLEEDLTQELLEKLKHAKLNNIRAEITEDCE